MNTNFVIWKEIPSYVSTALFLRSYDANKLTQKKKVGGRRPSSLL